MVFRGGGGGGVPEEEPWEPPVPIMVLCDLKKLISSLNLTFLICKMKELD